MAHTTLEQTAALLGVSRAGVPRLQQRFRAGLQPSPISPRGWGGRRRALLTVEEEKAFLAPWAEQACAAGARVVAPLRAVLAEKLGRRCLLGGVPPAGATGVAQSSTQHSASQKRSARPGGVEKKFPQTLPTLLTSHLEARRPVRLMFQDEARLGRMAGAKRCWAQEPLRPVVGNGCERKFVYVYGAVSPLQGELD